MNGQLQNHFEKIADGLAEDGFAVVDQFLSKQEVNQILQLDVLQQGLLQFNKAGVGKKADKQINEGIRGDYIHWIDPATADPSLSLYLARLKELTEFVNRSLFLSLKGLEVHLTVYPPGAYYRRHMDQFKSDDHRKLSVICYLNEDWTEADGGQLRMHLPSGPYDVLPVAGRLVCFRSDQIEHEVLAGLKPRLSLTGWMLDREG